MAVKKGQELGTKSPWKMRAGIDLAGFTGINRQKHPGAMFDSEVYDAINVRIVGGRLDNRWGQEKMSSTPLATCVLGIFDDEQG